MLLSREAWLISQLAIISGGLLEAPALLSGTLVMVCLLVG